MSTYEQLMQLIRERSTDYASMAQLAGMLFSNVKITERAAEISLLKAENEELKAQIHKLVQDRGTDLTARMFKLISEIRGPLYDHDMHDWESKCDALVDAYIKDERPKEDRAVPSIHVSVAFKGDTISHQSAFFMDAISFLCRAEEAARRSRNNPTAPADDRTAEITHENLQRLLREGKTAEPT